MKQNARSHEKNSDLAAWQDASQRLEADCAKVDLLLYKSTVDLRKIAFMYVKHGLYEEAREVYQAMIRIRSHIEPLQSY
ncbi:MAG TPA: hypothetical protein V6C72_10225 [Chroococcales cyanobacterium]